MAAPKELKTIREEVPANGSTTDATDSGIKDTQALDTIVQNYSIAEQNKEHILALQKWIREAQKEVEKQNAEAKKRAK